MCMHYKSLTSNYDDFSSELKTGRHIDIKGRCNRFNCIVLEFECLKKSCNTNKKSNVLLKQTKWEEKIYEN